MGYLIQYDPESRKRYPSKRSKENKRDAAIAVFLAIMILLTALGLRNHGTWLRWLLPGDPDITAKAVGDLVDDVRTGESIKEAITTFCLEIIEHAKTEE